MAQKLGFSVGLGLVATFGRPSCLVLHFDSIEDACGHEWGSMEKGIPVRERPGKSSDKGVVTQSGSRTRVVRSAAAIAAAGVLSAMLAGCGGMPSLTSGIGSGWLGGQSKSKPEISSVTEDQLLAAAKADTGTTGSLGEVAHGCPRFQVWAREGYVTIYEPGKAGDGLAVMHRGEITKTARECQIEPGRITVKVGFSGRVLLGPKGKTGHVTLPLNVFVTDSKRERLVNEKVKVDVDIALERPIGYFSMVRTLSFPMPEGSRPAEFEVYVGFDRTAPGAG
jgi:hypothetical protein